MSSMLACRRLAVFHRLSTHSFTFKLSQPVDLSHIQCCRTYATSSTERLPRIARPSLWISLIPKAFRTPEHLQLPANPQRKKEWNPATFFIWISLIIGSNAIQMIVLKNEYLIFSRKADTKIRLLKDVLDRLQRGENVDVEKALGTGDEEQEQEWRDVVKEVEDEGQLWQAKDRGRQRKDLRNEEGIEEGGAEEVAEQKTADDTDPENSKSTSKTAKYSAFY